MTIRIIGFASLSVLVIALVVAVLPGCGDGGSESEELEEDVETEDLIEEFKRET